MNASSNTEKAFAAMKEVPVEISTDAIRTIVLTSTAASVTVSKASIIAKLIHTKFHLNTIIAMTSFFSASIIGGVFLFSGWHSDHSKTAALNSFTKNIPEHPKITFNGGRPDLSLGVDTPQKSKQVVIVNEVNSVAPNDSNRIVIVNDDGHGRTITRVIVLDSADMAGMRMRQDSMMPRSQMTQTYTYTYDNGRGHKHGRGKNANCVVINESQVLTDADIAMADANIAMADADIARADAQIARNDAQIARNDSQLNMQRCYSYAYSDMPPMPPMAPMPMNGNGKCIIITDMNGMNPDSLPPMDAHIVIMNDGGMQRMHDSRNIQIVKQGPGINGNDAEQIVIVNDAGPQIAMIDNGEMHSDSVLELLTEKLFADKLISDQKKFTFAIDGKSLKVNGAKQSDDIYQVYKTYIETISPNKVDKHFLYDLTVNGDNVQITVHNYEN